MKEHHVSIWFLIGLQLAIYGLLITGAGIYGLISPPPPEQQTVLAEWHASIWWGGLMLILGVFYTVKFRPK
ncbi:MAG: hypothetical protein LV480_08405 [Methylacidiphilales bacterium]|nr:hypothetical protein [Candidatus Methylacidiphilales bacterium]